MRKCLDCKAELGNDGAIINHVCPPKEENKRTINDIKREYEEANAVNV